MGLYGTRRALLKGKRSYSEKVLGYSPVAYWPLWEVSGTTAECLVNSAQNGTYTGVTLANATAPDGSPCPYFDGANDYVDVFSATFAGAFNGAEGTVCIWTRTDDWVTGDHLFRFEVTQSNYVEIKKNNTVDRFETRYGAGGVTVAQAEPAGQTTTVWRHAAMTWSASADELRLFINGSQIGATVTGLGVWAGTLNANTTLIGALAKVPASVWLGYLAHCAVWDTALTPTQIADLATV